MAELTLEQRWEVPNDDTMRQRSLLNSFEGMCFCKIECRHIVASMLPCAHGGRMSSLQIFEIMLNKSLKTNIDFQPKNNGRQERVHKDFGSFRPMECDE